MTDPDTRSESMAAMGTVPRPRAVRRLAISLVALLTLLPFVLSAVPWVQTVPGGGRVTALDPTDRTQVIPAPVTGRLVELNVREGQHVTKGEVLAELADQDPQYALRLEQQALFASNKVQAAKDQVTFYETQLEHLVEARELALSSAQYELNSAIEKVRAEEQELEASEAEYEQKFADRERKWQLYQKKVASELDFQRAEAASRSARAKVEAAKAEVEQARNAELGKMASMGKVGSDLSAKLESTKSSREEARTKVALAEKELNESLTKVERQKTRVVAAPRTGWVLRVHAADSTDLIKQGDPLIEIIPDAAELSVELWVRGVDAPLIEAGRKVRLQFEGWPAVQFAGWPSVAVGTFGGVVTVVDAQGASDGRFRALILPDPDDAPWPDRRYLRQGVRTQGWVMLDTVSLGYEVWRQLNAFPPSIQGGPFQDGKPGSDGGKSKSESKKKGDKS